MPNKLVFIGGMGRSGTHYLGRVLGEHPEVKLRLESKFTFWSITNHVAYNMKITRLRFWAAVGYLKVNSMLTNKLIVEKTHPAIWVKNKIDRLLPNAKWVCVVRDPYQAAASMKKHAGVKKWYTRVSQNEVNPFLGITEQNRSRFAGLSIAQKSTYKWIAHMEQMERIQLESPNRVLIVQFENLVQDQANTLISVFDFLGLAPVTPKEKGNQSTLSKKQELGQNEVNAIDEILRSHKREKWIKYRPIEQPGISHPFKIETASPVHC
ncbi:MAG: sulfotransferase [Flavobacteriales bacterium]|nr:sulfotransferase [Flavobacteriales bacterium]